jgi:hypothetical protein
MDQLSSLIVIGFIVLFPVLWQVPRVFWPIRLNASATHFTGLYRRYSVSSFTGYSSDIQTWTDERTIGSVSAQTSGTSIGGNVDITVVDRRRQFSTPHTGFFLTDSTGATVPVDATNVSPSVGEGHLVSAAWIVHNRKAGNAFVVYNHTTDTVYLEATRSRTENARRGLFKMVFPLPVVYQVLLFLGIVTIPLMVVFGASAHWHVRRFRKRGVRPLVSALKQGAAGMPLGGSSAALRSAPAQSQPNDVIDLVTQVKEITALHESGALTADEFQAAKTKLLGR